MILYFGRTESLRVSWLTRLESAIRLLFHGYWCANRGVFEERLGHPSRQANATVRRGIRRDIALMHGVAASEEHGIRHLGAVEMRAGRPAVLAHVDIRSHHVAVIIDVITEDG